MVGHGATGSTPAPAVAKCKQMSDEALWIFGYGSLIWRPDIPFDAVHPAYVQGWARRFWQGSTDHRGVPGAPGRVVTLVAQAGARTVGRVFRVPPSERAAVLARLDHREKGGYERRRVEARGWPDGEALAPALVYLATDQNPQWLGPAADAEIAACIAQRVGPSGPNREYLLRLAAALRELDASDPHVEALTQLVDAKF